MNELISHLFRLEMSFVVVITRAFCSAAEQSDSLAVGCLVEGQPAPLQVCVAFVSHRNLPFLPPRGSRDAYVAGAFCTPSLNEKFWGD